jgi:hypothetical protein
MLPGLHQFLLQEPLLRGPRWELVGAVHICTFEWLARGLSWVLFALERPWPPCTAEQLWLLRLVLLLLHQMLPQRHLLLRGLQLLLPLLLRLLVWLLLLPLGGSW